MKMKGKVALITGGTSGIGRAAAVAFANEGSQVVITGRREDMGKETLKLVEQAGSKGLFIKADVSIEADCKRMVDETLKTFGRLDYAFNNAGIEGASAPVVEESYENINQVLNINVAGVLLSMKYEIPAMRKSGGGAIVNTSSIAGRNGMAGMSTYVASKHAVNGISKCAALEVAKEGIRINIVSPAAIETEMYTRFTQDDRKTQDFLRDLHPIGRVGTPEEVANAVIFLCSDLASFITGTDLLIDGGYSVP